MTCPARIVVSDGDQTAEVRCAFHSGHTGDCVDEWGARLDVAAGIAATDLLGYVIRDLCDGNGWVGVRAQRALERCPSWRPDAS